MRHENDRMVLSPPFLPSLASPRLEGPSRVGLTGLPYCRTLIRPPPLLLFIISPLPNSLMRPYRAAMDVSN